MKPYVYVCDACGGEFESEWTEEEAMEESKKLWGDLPPEKLAQICDDCFKRGKDAALAEHRRLQ